MSEIIYKVRTPLFPTYSIVKKLLQIFAGVQKTVVTGMIRAIMDQTGTPQLQVDWSEPDKWISERLTGDSAILANRIWSESHGTVNPRHVYGAYLFINTFELLSPDFSGIYQLTDRGSAFNSDDPQVIRDLDDAEGMLQLLLILSVKGKAKHGELTGEWADFLHEHSKFGTPSTIKDTLRRRLANLVEREFVKREGITYELTPKGLEYLKKASPKSRDPHREVLQSIKIHNDSQKKHLKELLGKMPPYRFEHLVKELLEAMGYEDVSVTKQYGDKGVDVVATAQFGITTVKEVVQVKRHQASIIRTVLDQLRGVLPFHSAIRGTVITLGKFSGGCVEVATFPGAPPITLIDGDKLIDLLFEHGVGIRKNSAVIYEIDEVFLTSSEEVEGIS